MVIDTRKILHAAFDKHTKNVERYTHNGSTWLIFTDEKKWVIELTKEGTLWYNYYFFQNIMKLLSLEVVENQHYITEWVEDNIISKVKKTRRNGDSMNTEAEDAIEDGVKQTKRSYEGSRKQRTKDTIQNGVKDTREMTFHSLLTIEDTLQNGVKETKGEYYKEIQKVEYTIQNGVKETHLGGKDRKIGEIKDIIENGVKVTYSDKIPHEYDWSNQFTEEIDDIIQNGVKHTEYGDWLDGDERFDDIIENGVKETWGYEKQPQKRIDEVIMNGQKD